MRMPVFSHANEQLFQVKWNAILGILETWNLVSHSFYSLCCLFVAFSPNPVSRSPWLRKGGRGGEGRTQEKFCRGVPCQSIKIIYPSPIGTGPSLYK